MVAIGVVARFVAPSPLWLDEALTANLSSLPLGDIGPALRRDGHPPLYYWLLHAWSGLFGDGDAALRALAGIASVATLPLAWVAGRRVGGRSCATAALILFALSPYLIRYATEIRMYALVTLVVVAGQVAVRRALERPAAARLVPVAVLVGAALWLHYWAGYLVVATAVVVAVSGWRADARARRATRRVVVALGVGALTLLPWLPALLDQLARTGTPWADPTRPTTALATTLDDLGGTLLDAHLLGVTVALLAALALFVVPRGPGGGELAFVPSTVPGVRGELAVTALTLGLGGAVTYLTGGGYATRYAAVVVPLLLIAAATGVARLPRPGQRAATLVVASVLAVPGLADGVTTDRSQAGEIVAALDAQAADGDVVVFCPDQLGPAFSRGIGPDVDAIVYPTAAPPDLVDWRDYEQRNAAADPFAYADAVVERAQGRPVWLVWAAGYRTFDTQCELLASRLEELRTPPVPVVVDGGADYAEHAWLFRFDAPA